MTWCKQIAINFFIVVLSLFSMLTLLEIAVRIHQLIRYDTPLYGSPKGLRQKMYIDPKLGWRNTAYFSNNKLLKGDGSNKYNAVISTERYGFQLFSNDKGKSKVFIVGDSTTAADHVSNDKTYWGILADRFKDIQFYVYGSGGYGNLQEFMIIDEYVDEIRPQMLLLQLCTNDFVNNDYALEYYSYENNNGMRRPYINSAGEIFYKNPYHIKLLPESFMEYSRLLLYMNSKMQVALLQLKGKDTIERKIENTGPLHKEFQHSAKLTKIIMQKIKDRYQPLKIIVFCVDYHQPFYDEFKKIAKSVGFEFIDGIPQAIEAYEKQGYITRAEDKAHWNDLGHKIAGEKLYEYFLNYGLQ